MTERLSGAVPDPLSPAGRARREAMLGELVATMERWHVGRRRRRRILASLGLVALASLVALGLVRAAPVPPAPVVAVAPPAPPRAARFELVTTDATVVERLAVGGGPRTVMIDDTTLLTELAAMNRPTGLVRRGGRVWLTRDVVGTPSAAPGSS